MSNYYAVLASLAVCALVLIWGELSGIYNLLRRREKDLDFLNYQRAKAEYQRERAEEAAET